MTKRNPEYKRPDVVAAIRGGDPLQPMETEPDIDTASLEQAVFWYGTYREILAMEEKVLARVGELMSAQSVTSRREVELSNVPVITAQVERFRSRMGYWDARLQALQPA